MRSFSGGAPRTEPLAARLSHLELRSRDATQQRRATEQRRRETQQ